MVAALRPSGVVRKHELVNPLDPYSISSTSEVHAAAAAILLSGLAEVPLAVRERLPWGKPGRVICPPFHLSGERGIDAWWRTRPESRAAGGYRPFFAWVETELEGIADALDSIQLEASARMDPVDLLDMVKVLSRDIREKLRKARA